MPMADIEFNRSRSIFARFMGALRGSAVWLGTVVFAALAAMAAFFFALAALAGTFIIVGTLALIWLIFRIAGSRRKQGDPNTLNARRGPHGWTVDGFGPFGGSR